MSVQRPAPKPSPFGYANYTSLYSCQDTVVRCPGHTIQFLGYGYSKYIEKTLELLGISVDYLEWRKYETWTPYSPNEGCH